MAANRFGVRTPSGTPRIQIAALAACVAAGLLLSACTSEDEPAGTTASSVGVAGVGDTAGHAAPGLGSEQVAGTLGRLETTGEVVALSRVLAAERRKTRVGPRPTKARAAAVMVELASVPSIVAALGEWERLRQRHAPSFDALKATLRRADASGAGGYRLAAGPFANTEKTEALCARLKRRGLGCRPVAR